MPGISSGPSINAGAFHDLQPGTWHELGLEASTSEFCDDGFRMKQKLHKLIQPEWPFPLEDFTLSDLVIPGQRLVGSFQTQRSTTMSSFPVPRAGTSPAHGRVSSAHCRKEVFFQYFPNAY